MSALLTILKIYVLFHHVHIGSHCEEGGDGDESVMDSDGVAVEVARTYVRDLLAGLQVHIAVCFLEGIREIMRALIGEADAVDAVGNINVIDEVVGEEVLTRDKFVRCIEVCGGVLLTVWEGGERDASVAESARLKDSGYSTGVDEVDAHVYTSVDAGEYEVVLSAEANDAETDAIGRSGIHTPRLDTLDEGHFFYFDRVDELYGVAHRALFNLRRNYGNLAELLRPLCEQTYAGSVYAVVVGYKYSHSQPSLLAL